LTEEKETDAKLTELAEQINASAVPESAEEGEEEKEPVKKGKSKIANA
jgi:hypothetical protein